MASITGTPVVVTDAGTVLADTHTASAAGLELVLCVAERGTTGTSPSVLTYGGVSALANPITALIGTASGQRVHRWYRIPKASHPGTGTHVVACTWAGVDNIAVAILEISSTGTLSYPSSDQAASGTVAITAGTGDLTISCAQGNSATPAFTALSGQTKYLESVWFASSGHVVGVQTGVQTAANWSGAGSICASAFVIHEEIAGGDVNVNATGSGAGVAVAAGSVTLSASLAATGSAAAQGVAAGQVVPSASVAASGQVASLAVAAGDVTVTGADQTVAATGSGAGIATEAGSVTLSASLPATGSGAAIAGAIGPAALGVTLPVTGSALAVAVAAGQVALQATLAATGSAASLAMATGSATVDGADELPHTLAPALFTFRDPATVALLADAQEPTTYRDESAATIAYD